MKCHFRTRASKGSSFANKGLTAAVGLGDFFFFFIPNSCMFYKPFGRWETDTYAVSRQM